MELSAVHMVAYGRVQGVGFRFFVRQRAAAVGIKGWVRNLPDGSVEILAEGEKDMLDIFIDRVKHGPAFGRVSELDIDWIEPSHAHTHFTIEF